MAFNTTSYLAGVGSVVAALTIGFSSGFFFAAPTQNDPPNRLQRVTSNAPLVTTATAPASPASKEEMPKQDLAAVASAPIAPADVPSAGPAAAPPVVSATTPSDAAPAPSIAAPPQQQAAQPEPTPVVEKAPEPVAAPAQHERNTQISAEKTADKIRAAEASRAAERKKIETKKLADRQRRQREIQEAAVAVKRMLRDRNVQEVADTPAPIRPGSAFSASECETRLETQVRSDCST